ncbi:hypothetical protein GEMRC1_003489 [Eukaryota sp. GEM-RC1]
MIPATDVLALMARCLLIFQILVVYPILVHVIRQSVFGLFSISDPTISGLTIVSCGVVVIGTSFSVFYPQIGDLLRYFGSVSGMIYTYSMPCLAHLTITRKEGRCGFFSYVGHGLIILLGVVLCLLQFI